MTTEVLEDRFTTLLQQGPLEFKDLMKKSGLDPSNTHDVWDAMHVLRYCKLDVTNLLNANSVLRLDKQ
jgi:hypothetical protein